MSTGNGMVLTFPEIFFIIARYSFFVFSSLEVFLFSSIR